MTGEDATKRPNSGGGSPAAPRSGHSPPREDRRQEPKARREAADIWDAFELDDETANPQPEPGDFWPQLEEEDW